MMLDILITSISQVVLRLKELMMHEYLATRRVMYRSVSYYTEAIEDTS
jgi:hypothetical protein